METRAVQRQRAKAVILSTACIALALSITDNASGSPQASRSSGEARPRSAFHPPALPSAANP